MLKNMVDYHEKAQAAINNNPEMTWSKIREHTSDILYRLTQQKFEDPRDGEEAIVERFNKLESDMDESFRSLVD